LCKNCSASSRETHPKRCEGSRHRAFLAGGSIGLARLVNTTAFTRSNLREDGGLMIGGAFAVKRLLDSKSYSIPKTCIELTELPS